MLQDLEDANKYLSASTKFTDRKVYILHSISTRRKVHKLLADQGANIIAGENETGRAATKIKDGSGHEARIDLFNTSDLLLGMFVPADVESPTTNKFWGAVYDILEVRFALFISLFRIQHD